MERVCVYYSGNRSNLLYTPIKIYANRTHTMIDMYLSHANFLCTIPPVKQTQFVREGEAGSCTHTSGIG